MTDNQRPLPGLSSPSANAITAEILLAIPKRFPDARAWRRNVGVGVGVDTVKRAISLMVSGAIPAAIALLRSRPVTFGMPGEGDIDGIIPIGRHGIRLCIEIKAGKDTVKPHQAAFGEMIRSRGGIYVLARDVEQALQEIERQLAEKRCA